MVHTDQIGVFSITWQQGFGYIMVVIELYLLQIDEEQYQGRDDQCLPKNGKQDETLGTRVETSSFRQLLFGKSKKCITKNGMTHELVPPDCNHCNISKQAIQTFMNHLVSILSRVDNRFPLSLWCHLVQPVEPLSTYYNRATLHQKCPHMPMSVGNTTT
jgi:hypothetical protein